AGLVWFCFWIAFYRKPAPNPDHGIAQQPQGPSHLDEEESQGKLPWSKLLGYRQTWSFVLAKFLTDPVWWFFLIWLPDFFHRTRGLDIKRSWVHLVTIYGIITLLSIAGAWVTGFLAGKGWTVTRARKTSMFCFALGVLPILAVTRVGDWTAVLLIGLVGASH